MLNGNDGHCHQHYVEYTICSTNIIDQHVDIFRLLIVSVLGKSAVTMKKKSVPLERNM